MGEGRTSSTCVPGKRLSIVWRNAAEGSAAAAPNGGAEAPDMGAEAAGAGTWVAGAGAEAVPPQATPQGQTSSAMHSRNRERL